LIDDIFTNNIGSTQLNYAYAVTQAGPANVVKAMQEYYWSKCEMLSPYC